MKFWRDGHNIRSWHKKREREAKAAKKAGRGGEAALLRNT
jgi:hypothetical protein